MRAMVAFISVLVRQLCLPNPFECFGDMAFFYNWIAGLVLAPVSFALVGLVYRRGEHPVWGSFLYLITYAVLTWLLWVLGRFSFAWWWVSIIGIAVVAVWVLLIKFRR